METEVKMKKLTLAIVLIAVVGLLALPVPASAIQFGLKAGANSANLTGLDAQDSDLGTLSSKLGFVGGVFLNFPMGSVFSLQLEGLYTMKGSDVTVTDVETFTGKLYANYIEIPLVLKIRIPTPGISPFVFAGASVGFKLSEKLTVDGQDVPLEEAFFKNNDYGAIFGGGLNIGGHFHLDVRYSMGLEKVISTIEGETPLDIKTGVWSATIGIGF
jgi:outer membrane immunogenic protein